MGGNNLSCLSDLAGRQLGIVVGADVGYRNIYQCGCSIADANVPGVKARDENRALLSKLAKALAHNASRPGDDSRVQGSDENPRIPAGYTYLAQFMVHDVVESLGLFPTATNGLRWRRNERTVPLMLDALYGGGPSADPMLYQPERSQDATRGYFRIGIVRPTPGEEGTHASVGTGRDIPRLGCPFLSRGGLPDVAAWPAAENGRDAVLNDIRNDDNAIMSQLTLLFMLLHNSLLAQLEQPNPMVKNPGAKRHERFNLARRIVTLVYRRIIFDELLPLLLHPAVLHEFRERRYTRSDIDDRRIPVEFSHAAGRIGHAMLRRSYTLNDRLGAPEPIESIVRHNSSFRSEDMPFTDHWLIDWSHFFELGRPEVNLSRKLGPSFAVSDEVATVSITPETATQSGGLVLRDLVRGAESGLLSVQQIIDALPLVSPLSPLVKDGRLDAGPIEAWLQPAIASTDLTADEVRRIVDDPPLLLFLLFEAAETEHRARPVSGKGERLGPIGSAIWGETLFPARAFGQPLIEDDAELARAADDLFQGKVPGTMPDLLREIARREKWENPEYAFI